MESGLSHTKQVLSPNTELFLPTKSDKGLEALRTEDTVPKKARQTEKLPH